MYGPYFGTLGGGELYLGTIAEILSRNHEVDLVSENPIPLAALKEFFGLNLDGVHTRIIPPVPFVESSFPFRVFSYRKATRFTCEYDLFIIMPRNFRIPFRVLSPKNILHLQVPDRPWNSEDFAQAFLNLRISDMRNEVVKALWYPKRYSQFDAVLLNSWFHSRIISGRLNSPRTFVLNPPVRMRNAVAAEKKTKIILSVGRFFSGLHSKRQDVLIRCFQKLAESLPGWKLVLAGGLKDDPPSQKYFAELSTLAQGSAVELKTNIAAVQMDELYETAAIYWHASGYEADDLAPEKMEHFGISTVEAMSAGCVPVVFQAGGQLEIIQDGKNGLFWRTEQDLVAKTLQLVSDREKLRAMSAEASERSREFSREKFEEKFLQILDMVLA